MGAYACLFLCLSLCLFSRVKCFFPSDKSVQNGIRDSFARMAAMHDRRFARCFCRDSGNIAWRYFLYKDKSARNEIRDFYAHMAFTYERRFARCFCRYSGNIA